MKELEKYIYGLQNDFVVVLLLGEGVMQRLHEVAGREDGRAVGVAGACTDKHNNLQNNVIFGNTWKEEALQQGDEIVVDEVLSEGHIDAVEVGEYAQNFHEKGDVIGGAEEADDVGNELHKLLLVAAVMLRHIANDFAN